MHKCGCYAENSLVAEDYTDHFVSHSQIARDTG